MKANFEEASKMGSECESRCESACGGVCNFEPDDGYFFGLGAFETIAVYGDKPLFAKQHLKRLANTLEFLKIDCSWDDLAELLEEGLRQIDTSTSAGKALKISVSQNNRIATIRDNPYTPTSTPTLASRNRSFALITSQVVRNQTSPLVRHKTFNYADNLLQKRLALKMGYDEPVFCNMRGCLSEGATTNVFVIIDGHIITPPVCDGLLPGIMRGFVMSRFDVEERSITSDEARECDAMFVTNSLMGAMPVRLWDDRIFDDFAIAHEVQAEYESIYMK